MSSNPYAAPKTAVADATVSQGNFIPGGRAVGAGRGWDWIASGWGLFKKQPGTWIGLTLVGLLIFIAIGIIPFVGSLALALLGPVFAAGVILGCRALEDGAELQVGHLFAGFRDKLGSLAAIGALNLVAQILIMVVVMLITGASMFAMMRGGGQADATGMSAGILLAGLIAAALMIPVAMAVWFAPALVVLNGRGTVEAMKESFAGCLKNIVPYLLYGVVLFILAILASVPLALGWLVLGPVIAASVYTAYRDIYYTE